MTLYRDYCCDCGRPESLWSAIKRELKRRFSKPEPDTRSPYQRYFDEKLLEAFIQTTSLNKYCEARPLPANAGAYTIRFTKTNG